MCIAGTKWNVSKVGGKVDQRDFLDPPLTLALDLQESSWNFSAASSKQHLARRTRVSTPLGSMWMHHLQRRPLSAELRAFAVPCIIVVRHVGSCTQSGPEAPVHDLGSCVCFAKKNSTGDAHFALSPIRFWCLTAGPTRLCACRTDPAVCLQDPRCVSVESSSRGVVPASCSTGRLAEGRR